MAVSETWLTGLRHTGNPVHPRQFASFILSLLLPSTIYCNRLKIQEAAQRGFPKASLIRDYGMFLLV